MIKITFECETVSDLQREMLSLIKNMGVAPTSSDDQMEFPQDYVVAIPIPTKKTRKPKAEKVAEEIVKEPEVAVKTQTGGMTFSNTTSTNFTTPQHATPTRESVHQALQEVNAACGLPKAREILKEFGAQRISDLKEESYVGFVNKCSELVAQV